MSRFAKQIVGAGAFQHFIVAMIVLAGVVAGLETSAAMMERHGALLMAMDRVIVGVFLLEAVLKMASHGRQPWRYFADGWNVFDFLIVLLCLLPVAGPFAAVLRLARALRLLRLISVLPKLQLLVGALLKSLSAMGYVSLLLALLFYIYAVAGIHLFGVHDPQHFGSLPAAFLSLFRLVTLDNWTDLFSAQLTHVPGIKVAIYFVSFIVFGTMIILNLFIGIIMNSMAEAHAEQAREAARVAESKMPGDAVLARLDRATKQLAELQAALHGLRDELESRGAPPAPEHPISCQANLSSPSTPTPALSSCRGS